MVILELQIDISEVREVQSIMTGKRQNSTLSWENCKTPIPEVNCEITTLA